MSHSHGTHRHRRPPLDAARPCAVTRALAEVRRAPGIVPALRLLDDLVAAAADDDGSALPLLTRAVTDTADELTAIAAVHALGVLPDRLGHPALIGLLRTGAGHLREHAAWALSSWSVAHEALEPLGAMVATGGFGGMLAQRTLERWGRMDPDAVRVTLTAALVADDPPAVRARLVETLGLLPGGPATRVLVDVAADGREDASVRAVAAAALGDRPTGGDLAVTRTLLDLADGTGPLADTARTALSDLGPQPPSAAHAGLTVVQLFLHADIDADLSQAGRGDNGGIATLLVQLGDALLAQDRVERVVTVSRGVPADAAAGFEHLRSPGHHYASVPLWGTPPHQAQAWPLRVAARRGIRRILRAAGPVDVLHLRMADVGSMAAAEAARDLGVRVVFTLAPDPQALVAAREAAGTLTRAGFGAADLAEHLVLRDQLVRGLAAEADHLVLFPRPEVDRDLRDLLGVDLADPTVHATVVAEGVDLAAIDLAGTTVATAGGPDAAVPPHLAALDAVLEALPVERRGLPLAMSVGRLHRVKGMATLVETWAADPGLSERCNLLVVGGDLEHPSDDETGELDRMAATVAPADAARRGLLLAGHRRNAVVAVWLAAARRGRPGLAAPDGIYVSASLKEEFGIAILEAMSAGLVVVAPDGGGPATYVDDGVTGVLVDTTSSPALARAVTRALELARDPDAVTRADHARECVRHRFGIGTMAAALTRVYESVASGAGTTDGHAAL